MNKAEKQGMTPLTHAASQGSCDLVTMFIETGTDVKNLGNALLFAAGKGDVKCMKALIRSGASVNWTEADRITSSNARFSTGTDGMC